MRLLKVLMIALLGMSLWGCAKTDRYSGPRVTKVVVNKEARKMHLLHGHRVLKSYDIGLGFRPSGDKKIQGDGKTPEGRYFIDRRNPESKFYLSLGISYPNARDVAEARALGRSPGGDIFIHGRPWKYRKGGPDWTAGCIAVTNNEMREIYRMVRVGTPIQINP
jgi:murein L,D-transpeptidase YafK